MNSLYAAASAQPLACQGALSTPPMIELQTLGAAVVRVGSHKVLPSTGRAFATLLFLIEERNREVRRTELEAVLFPGEDAQETTPKIGQMLSRLRRIGAPVEAHGDCLTIPASAVRTDYTRLADAEAVTDKTVNAVTGGVMPGYAPRFSRPLAQWVEERRTAIQHDVLQQLVGRLTVLRGERRWHELDSLARAVLALDPLNERATLAVAESLAFNGQKDEARFRDAAGRAREATERAPGRDVRIEALRDHLGSRGLARYPEAMAIRSGDSYSVVRVADIEWIEADGNYATVHARGNARLITRSLTTLERELLDPDVFVRVHRSAIVNMRRVASVDMAYHGDLELILVNGVRVRCSRRCRARLEAAMYFTT